MARRRSLRLVGEIAHPEPGLGHHVVVAGHIEGAVEVAAGGVAVAGLQLDDAGAEQVTCCSRLSWRFAISAVDHSCVIDG